MFLAGPPMSGKQRHCTPRPPSSRSLTASISANRRDASSRCSRWTCRASNPALPDSLRHACLSHAFSSGCEVDKWQHVRRNTSPREDHEVRPQTGPAVSGFRREAVSEGTLEVCSARGSESAFRHERHKAMQNSDATSAPDISGRNWLLVEKEEDKRLLRRPGLVTPRHY